MDGWMGWWRDARSEVCVPACRHTDMFVIFPGLRFSVFAAIGHMVGASLCHEPELC